MVFTLVKHELNLLTEILVLIERVVRAVLFAAIYDQKCMKFYVGKQKRSMITVISERDISIVVLVNQSTEIARQTKSEKREYKCT